MYKTTSIFGWIARWTDVVYGTHAEIERKREPGPKTSQSVTELTADGIVRARAQQRDCRGWVSREGQRFRCRGEKEAAV